MAIIASVQAGNWSSSATWGGVIPGPGDRAQVLHAVTVDAAVTIGDSPAVGQAGTGTVASGGNVLQGSGTAFTTQLRAGYLLDFGATGLRAVASVTDNTHLSMGDLAFSTYQSFTFTPWVLYVSGANGRLTVNAPLKVRGPLVQDYRFQVNPLTTIIKVEGAGAGIEIDASQAASPSTTRYPIVLQIGGSWSRFHFAGTSSNRVYFRSNASGGNAYISRWGSYYGSWQKYEYCDLTRIGTATIPAGPVDMSQDIPEFVLNNCMVDSCGIFTQAGMAGSSSAGGVLSIAGTTFKNGVDTTNGVFGASVALPGGVAGGSYTIKGSVFDKAVVVGSDYYTVGGTSAGDWNVFSGPWPYQHQTNGQQPATLFRNNLVHMTRSANTPFQCPSTVQDTYILVDLVPGDFNQHPCAMSSYYRHDLIGVIWEWGRSDPDGDFIQVPGPSSALGTYVVKNCIKLPAADGNGGGSITAGGSDFTAISFEHNTIHLGTFGCFSVGETYAGHAGMFTSIRSNAIWDSTPRESCYRSSVSFFSAMPADLVAPANFRNNGRFNTITAANNTLNGVANQTIPGCQYVKFSAAPGTADLTSDPQFLQAGAGIEEWDASLGGPGTMANALAELKKKNDVSGYNTAYTLPALFSFVRGKHRPTNAAYQGATYSGDAATVDAAGNSLAGTIGAMAYQGGVTLTAGTAVNESSRPGRHVMRSTDAIGGTGPYTKRWQRSAGAGSYANLTDGSGVSGATTLVLLDGSAAKGVVYHYHLVYTDAVSATVTGNVVSPTPLADVIPDRAGWEARLPGIFATYAPYLAAKVGYGTDVSLNDDINHDGMSVALRCLPRFPGNSAMLSYVAENRRIYRDQFGMTAYGQPPPHYWNIQGYYCFPEGLALDWLVNGNATSKAQLDQLKIYGAFMSSGTGMESESVSRETAYSILAHVWARKCGLTWDRTLLDGRVTLAMGHIDQWTDPGLAANLTASGWYVQPFMMGITMTALAMYLDHIEDVEGEVNTTIQPKLVTMANWLWDNAWERNFHYGNFPLWWKADPESPDAGYNNLLNMYAVYPFMWLWDRTGDLSWRDRSSHIFNNGVGTTDMNAPKKLNEYARWSTLAMDLYQANSGAASLRKVTCSASAGATAPVTTGRLRLRTASGLFRIGLAP